MTEIVSERRESAAARVPVVPVLVEGAVMPAAADLPPSLAEFSRCQAVELADRRWRADIDALVEALQLRFAIEFARWVRPASQPRTPA